MIFWVFFAFKILYFYNGFASFTHTHFAYGRHWISWCVRIVASITKTNRNKQKRTIKNPASCVICHVSHVTCHVPGVKFHILHVACHLSQTQTATTTDSSPANSPVMTSRLVHKDPKAKKKSFRKITKRQKHKNVKTKNRRNNKNPKCLEVCLWSEVCSPPESRV